MKDNVPGDSEGPPTLIDLVVRIKTFRWVALHLGLFGLLACLARAPRLGRPSPDAPSDADRPAAHAEAVGALLRAQPRRGHRQGPAGNLPPAGNFPGHPRSPADRQH